MSPWSDEEAIERYTALWRLSLLDLQGIRAGALVIAALLGLIDLKQLPSRLYMSQVERAGDQWTVATLMEYVTTVLLLSTEESPVAFPAVVVGADEARVKLAAMRRHFLREVREKRSALPLAIDMANPVPEGED